jgi:hypothetical protein
LQGSGFCGRAGGKTREFLVIEKSLIQSARGVDVPHFIDEKREPVFSLRDRYFSWPILLSGLHLKWLKLHQISVRFACPCSSTKIVRAFIGSLFSRRTYVVGSPCLF